jgi:hypothetical protein
MGDSRSPRKFRKASYWVLSALLIIALFIISFGAYAILFENHLTFSKILGSAFGAIGLAILLTGIIRPASLIKSITKKEPSEINSVAANALLIMGFAGLGLGFIIGGLVYGLTSQVRFLFFCVSMPAFTLLVASFIAGR